MATSADNTPQSSHVSTVIMQQNSSQAVLQLGKPFRLPEPLACENGCALAWPLLVQRGQSHSKPGLMWGGAGRMGRPHSLAVG